MTKARTGECRPRILFGQAKHHPGSCSVLAYTRARPAVSRPMKIRSHLSILALGTIVPVAIFAIVVAVWLGGKEREALRAGAERRSLALLTPVDAELKGHLTTVDALASVPSLHDGNLAYFHEVAENALKSQQGWLNLRLATPDGKQLFDLRNPDGSPSQAAL